MFLLANIIRMKNSSNEQSVESAVQNIFSDLRLYLGFHEISIFIPHSK